MRDHPYAPFIDRVHKPAQYLGGEQGQAHKEWGQAECRVCLAFPDLYEIGMSHLGYKILYDIVNKQPDLLAERAYAVWSDMEAELRTSGQSLCSLESARPLGEFDIVGFSLQYELTYTNILQILDLGPQGLVATGLGQKLLPLTGHHLHRPVEKPERLAVVIRGGFQIMLHAPKIQFVCLWNGSQGMFDSRGFLGGYIGRQGCKRGWQEKDSRPRQKYGLPAGSDTNLHFQ